MITLRRSSKAVVCNVFSLRTTPILTRRFCEAIPSLTATYKSQVVAGSLAFDEKQYKLVTLLEKLQNLIERHFVEGLSKENPSVSENIPAAIPMATEGVDSIDANATTQKRLRGLYMYGDVGTGKTMLMDMFFTSVNLPHKRRVHFSEFMLEVHSRIHKHKQKLLQEFGRDIHLNLSSERDSITIIARDIAKEAQVLCFDEFQVTDICDAMILTRLFNELWKQNVVLVATSNRPPTDLYLNGLNRQYFLPFIERLQVNCLVRNINIHHDYRQGGHTAPNAYFVGNTPQNITTLRGLYEAELQRGNFASEAVTVPVMNNRKLTLSDANLQAGVCFVEFSALCETDRGASDYQALCAHFHTVFMPNIPVLSVLAHNEARRLITLIDAMYNSNVRFVWVADAPPAQLFEILTREEVEQGSAGGAALGTDHSWTSSRHSESTINNGEVSTTRHSAAVDSCAMNERNLRGAEQPWRPLDNNMYFDTSLQLTKSASKDGHGSMGAGSPVSNTTDAVIDAHEPQDAAQDELKVLEGELASVQELSFAFRRAASRLTEMSSVGYLEYRWRGRR